MAGLIIFIGLLGLTPFALSENAQSRELLVLDVVYGEEAHIKIPDDSDFHSCVLYLNNGSTYAYKSQHDPIPGKVVSAYSFWTRNCNLYVRNVDENDVGYWSIEVYQSPDEEPQIYRYRMNVQRLIKDGGTITVYAGHFVYMTLEKANTQLGDVYGCQVTDPEGTTYSTADLIWSMEIQSFGQCGVKMLTSNSTQSGEWRLRVKVSEYYSYTSFYDLEILSDDSDKYIGTVISLQRWKEGKIFVGPQSVSYCRVKDPKGVEVVSSYENCHYTVPTVTPYHDGAWTAIYGLRGRMEPVEITFNVTTYEAVDFNSTVETGPNGEIIFACHFRQACLSCQFVRPDGAIIDYTSNVANVAYTSYGNITNRHQQQFCGLKIWQPLERDYGAWKCYVTLRRDEGYLRPKTRVDGTIVQINRPAYHIFSYPLIKTEAKDIAVRRGRSFQVSCGANAVLSYCGLRSPNGTDFSIVKDVEKSAPPMILKYEGAGLLLGDCRATIPDADETHRGEWKCFMGIRNGTELEQTFNVVVTDTYLIAEKEVIAVCENTPSWINMSCHLHPYLSTQSIDYCRWVRPDGYGINKIANEAYVTTSNSTACSILLLHAENTANFGEWKCVAGLVGASQEEAWAYVRIQRVSEEMSMTYIVLISVAVVLVMFAATSLLVFQLRKAKRPIVAQQQTYPSDPYLPPKYS